MGTVPDNGLSTKVRNEKRQAGKYITVRRAGKINRDVQVALQYISRNFYGTIQAKIPIT